MKNHLPVIAILAVFSFPSGVHAAAGTMEGGPGCGLGAMLWVDSISKKHILQQSSIATTNLTGFQTFAISSGTSGCTNDGVIAQKETIDVFVGANFNDLLQQMAQGGGEHLVALATLIGIPSPLHPDFFLLLQKRYPLIPPGENATPAGLLENLYAALADHPALSQTRHKG